nr:hypothetical protein [Tanacetum cinerariifolium]
MSLLLPAALNKHSLLLPPDSAAKQTRPYVAAVSRQPNKHDLMLLPCLGSQTNTTLCCCEPETNTHFIQLPDSAAKQTIPIVAAVSRQPNKHSLLLPPDSAAKQTIPIVAAWGMVVLAAVVLVVAARGVVEKRRVRESGVEGRIDRVVGILFGFAGKILPKKFSDGGRVVAGGGCPVGWGGRPVGGGGVRREY